MNKAKDRTKFVIVGSGTLAGIMVDAYKKGLLPEYELVAILGVEYGPTVALANKAGCMAIHHIEDIIEIAPEYVVEAASVGAVKAYLPAILSAGINFMGLSIGAFADNGFCRQMKALAAENNVKIYLPSGAIGGYDVLRAITAMGKSMDDLTMEFTMNKSRVNMVGTALYDKCPESGEPAVIFEGLAQEAIEILPGHVNVAVAASMATVGANKMKVVIYSDPNDPYDEMRSSIKAPKASAELVIRSAPPDIAAWSIISLLNNLASPMQFA